MLDALTKQFYLSNRWNVWADFGRLNGNWNYPQLMFRLDAMVKKRDYVGTSLNDGGINATAN